MSGKRAENRVAQQARILEAARSEFADHGFEAVSMGEVAARAGVSRATVFNHFGSKRALVEAITEEVMSYYESLLRSALAERKTSVPDLIRALFTQMGTVIEENRRFYRGVFRHIARLRLGDDEGTSGHPHHEAALALRRELLVVGQQRGELSSVHDVEDLASAFDSLVNGTITRWLYREPDEPLHAEMQRIAEVFLGAVATEKRRSRKRRIPQLEVVPASRHPR